MSFKQFLKESYISKYKSDIELYKAVDLINQYCKNVSFDNPLVRGMNGGKDAYILDGSLRDRKSRTKINYHTIIIDHIIKNINDTYPLRSKSIICTTLDDLWATERFGPDVYAIFPYDGSTIAYMTKHSDMNALPLTVGNSNMRMRDIKYKLSDAKINDNSFKDIVNDIKKEIKNENHDLIKIFDDEDKVEQYLLDAFSPEHIGYDFGSIKDMYKNKAYGECWMNCKAIAIKYSIWEKMKKEND